MWHGYRRSSSCGGGAASQQTLQPRAPRRSGHALTDAAGCRQHPTVHRHTKDGRGETTVVEAPQRSRTRKTRFDLRLDLSLTTSTSPATEEQEGTFGICPPMQFRQDGARMGP